MLDASWYLPTFERQPRKEFEQKRIPTAQFFDIDKVSSLLLFSISYALARLSVSFGELGGAWKSVVCVRV